MAERDAGRDESRDPLDEDAAWAELVAAYGEQPDPATGRWPATGDDTGTPAGAGKDAKDTAEKDVTGKDASPEPSPAREEPPGSFIVYAPGVGPRDWSTPEPPEGGADDTDDADDEGHFIPPEPPPLPTGDVTARFAWIAVLGGPLLLLIMVLLQQELTWWVTTIGVGGFLGGFATLVLRMKDSDDEDDDPGRGAVV
ncbi:hypothetical protein [Streptomyces roseifaciens]|uniref:hypothetical protein n=1 Tax=Streptomyces roseifaciens TaxID=1488406 RepID=UPI0007180742|nr:hypothetical protein [Streptomyces roseifaciens]